MDQSITAAFADQAFTALVTADRALAFDIFEKMHDIGASPDDMHKEFMRRGHNEWSAESLLEAVGHLATEAEGFKEWALKIGVEPEVAERANVR